jgi:hypothetical protein
METSLNWPQLIFWTYSIAVTCDIYAQHFLRDTDQRHVENVGMKKMQDEHQKECIPWIGSNIVLRKMNGVQMLNH